MSKIEMWMLVALCAAGSVRADLMSELAAADRAADAAVAAVRTPAELEAKQAAWRAAWIRGLGGLPERTPLNARVTGRVACDGFTLENVLFESQPGVYVTAHLALPADPKFKAPHPAVLMPLGHSDTGILAPRYAAHLAQMARAGFAAFAWDPVSQGERRQSAPAHDYRDNCSTEHTRLGARGWLVGWNFARFRIWDGIRAVDYLETRPDVDLSKLGVCGTSGGGTMSAYLQALDPRIRVAFPNCYVSSLREVFHARGCHDAEQFYWNQLGDGVNHAALLALGQPRVALATGSRWKDYFPHAGAVQTFAVFTNLTARLGFAGPYWHFSCDGPHGLPAPTRAAQTDWMAHGIRGAEPPKPLADYWALGAGDHEASDPANKAPLPFPADAAFVTPNRQVRDLPGFRSLYDLLAARASGLASARAAKPGRDLREIARRRANIRPLAELLKSGVQAEPPFDHPNFGWWYLKGPFGCRRENEAALLATLGRSVVGRDAERILFAAALPPDAAIPALPSGVSVLKRGPEGEGLGLHRRGARVRRGAAALLRPRAGGSAAELDRDGGESGPRERLLRRRRVGRARGVRLDGARAGVRPARAAAEGGAAGAGDDAAGPGRRAARRRGGESRVRREVGRNARRDCLFLRRAARNRRRAHHGRAQLHEPRREEGELLRRGRRRVEAAARAPRLPSVAHLQGELRDVGTGPLPEGEGGR
ncbi:MAG: acetylxylan esterase [Kiritimatiellae bacterium]|nr:acetylxylan esterase [Kiritimatiellia bacterium]